MNLNLSSLKKPKVPPVPVIRAVNQVRDVVSKLSQKLVPPPVVLLEMIAGMWTSQAIGVVAQLGVADAITDEGTSIEKLSAKFGVDTESLYRVLRALTVAGLTEERPGRVFRLTSVGKCLRSDHPQSLRNMAIYQTTFNWPHWGRLDHAVKTGKSAASKVRGMNFFDHLKSTPEDAAVFDGAMVNISKLAVESVLAAYDFGSFGTIADVGGGHGALLCEILALHPKPQGILFDMPHVARGAQEYIAERGLSERIRLEPGSFFEAAPEGADAYLLKHILHDWSDEDCLKILRQIRSRIRSSGKLLVLETVVQGPNTPDLSKLIDLEMLVVTEGGKERTAEEFRALFARAGLRLERIIPTVSILRVLEVVPA